MEEYGDGVRLVRADLLLISRVRCHASEFNEQDEVTKITRHNEFLQQNVRRQEGGVGSDDRGGDPKTAGDGGYADQKAGLP